MKKVLLGLVAFLALAGCDNAHVGTWTTGCVTYTILSTTYANETIFDVGAGGNISMETYTATGTTCDTTVAPTGSMTGAYTILDPQTLADGTIAT